MNFYFSVVYVSMRFYSCIQYALCTVLKMHKTRSSTFKNKLEKHLCIHSQANIKTKKLEDFADKIIDCHILTCVNCFGIRIKNAHCSEEARRNFTNEEKRELKRMLERKSVQLTFFPVCTAIRASGLDSIVFSGTVFFFIRSFDRCKVIGEMRVWVAFYSKLVKV